MMKHFYHDVDGYSAENEQGVLLTHILTTIRSVPPADKCFRVAEIGVYKGKLTAMWYVMLNNWFQSHEDITPFKSFHYVGIDHFRGSEEHVRGEDYYGMAQQSLQTITGNSNLEIIRNDSVSQAKLYPNGWFDVVYIDASHDYDSVVADIQAWLPKVKRGGFLCGDDYKLWPEVGKAVDSIFPCVKCFGDTYVQWCVGPCGL